MNLAEKIAAVLAAEAVEHDDGVGVYVIVNKITTRAYIGQTTSFRKRRMHHWSDLRRGKHSNKALQADWNRYGAGAFLFCPVAQVDREALLAEEARLIAECADPYNTDDMVGENTGRPPLPPDEKQTRRAVYLPPALWAKIDAGGGIAWLREVIRRAKLPKV